MVSYIFRRMAYMLILLLVLSVCAFAIIQLPPGDYITDYIAELRMRGTDVDEAEVEALRHQYGLDKPIYFQYFLWMGKMVRGNMGWSFAHHRPVSDLLWERLPMTALISVLSLLFVYLVAVPIGIYSATHQYSFADYGFTAIGFVGLATPNFLLALVLMIVFFQLFDLKIGGLFSIAYVNAPWSFAKFPGSAEASSRADHRDRYGGDRRTHSGAPWVAARRAAQAVRDHGASQRPRRATAPVQVPGAAWR